MGMSYWRFAAMIATSTVVMFVLMYLHTYSLDHVYWSETRTWMAVLMGATMAVIMLGFMLGMYKDKRINLAIFAGSIVVFVLSLWLIRSQATVSGVDYMRAMIPHHSIAVLTSERAQIADPRVRKLADEIIAAQRREIAEMKYLIRAVDQEGAKDQAALGPDAPPAVVPAAEAIRQAELARVDLAELDQAELDKVLGTGARCGFAYSRHAGPVAALQRPVGGAAIPGVVKVHGRLVELQATIERADADAGERLVLRGDGIEVAIAAIDDAATSGLVEVDAAEAEALLRIGSELEVGYAGFYRCDDVASRGSAGRD